MLGIFLFELKIIWLSTLIFFVVGAMFFSGFPVTAEYAAEVTYPVGPASSGGTLLMTLHVFGSVLSLGTSGLYDTIGVENVMLLYIGVMIISLILGVLTKEDYRRMRAEKANEEFQMVADLAQ